MKHPTGPKTDPIESNDPVVDLDDAAEEPEEADCETVGDDEADGDEDSNVVESLIQERDQFKDLYLRTLAEFQNFRKRSREEQDQTRKYATESLATSLIPVLDNFERALAAIDAGASAESIAEGIRMVEKQLRSVLESVNVTQIPALGAHFDPNHHEAIGTEESAEHEPGTVTEVVSSGYKMHDRVIRAARVKVAKKK